MIFGLRRTEPKMRLGCGVLLFVCKDSYFWKQWNKGCKFKTRQAHSSEILQSESTFPIHRWWSVTQMISGHKCQEKAWRSKELSLRAETKPSRTLMTGLCFSDRHKFSQHLFKNLALMQNSFWVPYVTFKMLADPRLVLCNLLYMIWS